MIGYIYMPRMIVIGIMIVITRLLLCVSWRKFVEEEKTRLYVCLCLFMSRWCVCV